MAFRRGARGGAGPAGPAPAGNAGDAVRLVSSGVAGATSPDLICLAAELATTYAPSAVLRGVIAYTSDTLLTYICRRTAVSTYAWVALGGGGTHTAGTLAARPASPAAGDTYAVTSGVALGDRYACFVAGTWTLHLPSSYAATYPLTGGALDYAALAAYTAAGMTVAGTGLTASTRLGDGSTVPRFAIYGKANLSAVARTTVPSLRITSAAANVGDCWPYADAGGQAVIWLPGDLVDMQIDLTLAGNPDASVTAGGEYVRSAVSLVQWTSSDARPRNIVSSTAYSFAGGLDEGWLVDADSGSTGSTARTSSGGVIALDVRIIVREAEVELWTAPAGDALVQRIWQSNPFRRGMRRDLALVLGVGQVAAGSPVTGLYGELRSLVITGNRQ